jgi:hypothetical protein
MSYSLQTKRSTFTFNFFHLAVSLVPTICSFLSSISKPVRCAFPLIRGAVKFLRPNRPIATCAALTYTRKASKYFVSCVIINAIGSQEGRILVRHERRYGCRHCDFPVDIYVSFACHWWLRDIVPSSEGLQNGRIDFIQMYSPLSTWSNEGWQLLCILFLERGKCRWSQIMRMKVIKTTWPLVHEQTIPTERPPLGDEA